MAAPGNTTSLYCRAVRRNAIICRQFRNLPKTNTMEKLENTTFSITSNIDLLGFSNHLIMSNYDLRTKIGNEAIQRLKTLEDAVELINQEIEKHKEYYPETFRLLRFNDSLILGVDINPPIMPPLGKVNEGDSFTFNQVKNFYGEDLSNTVIIKKAQEDFDKEAFKVFQFLGITSRIHNYINDKEYNTQMPGCRTIISTGLRHKFYNNQGKEDYYSANFSFSNAYLANESGSKGGFSGNKCYIENNVAGICSLNHYGSRLIGFAKYKMTFLDKDPFEGKPDTIYAQINYAEVKAFPFELFNKKYLFRELNTAIASTFQALPILVNLVDSEMDKENTLLINIIDMIKNNTPDLSAPYSIENHPHFKYPLLYFSIKLDEDIKETIDYFLKNHSA